MKTCKKGLHQYEGRQCPECKRAGDAEYSTRRREYRNAVAARYRSERREQLRIKAATYYTANREDRLAYGVRYYAENTERVRARNDVWQKANPDVVRACHQRRRVRLLGADSEPVTPAHLRMLLDAQDGRCHYCRTPLGKHKHLDHRIPLSRGGSHSPSNVCWACPSCNLRKHTKTEAEFLGVN